MRRTCPFCMSWNTRLERGGGGQDPPSARVRCDNCGAQGPLAGMPADFPLAGTAPQPTGDDLLRLALERWNQRPDLTERIVQALMTNLSDRKGFNFDGVDEETLVAWREEWKTLVREA